MKLYSITTNENGTKISKGGNEKLTIGLNLKNKNIATIEFTEEGVRIWYVGNHYWDFSLPQEKEGWSECNHYVKDEAGLCLRCGYNTLRLSNKEITRKKQKS